MPLWISGVFQAPEGFPHFNRSNLEKESAGHGIGYSWMEDLGGQRHDVRPTISPNLALQSGGLRNYADHMMTETFHSAVTQLLGIASNRRIAVMCAEKLFWNCHRRLLSDYLCAQGIIVQHIVESGKLQDHHLTPEVRTQGKNVIYPLPLGFDEPPIR